MAKIKFTDQKIRGLKASNKRQEYYDLLTKGLCLRVSKTGKKTFSYEYNFRKKKKRLTLGEYGIISLKFARDQVKEAKVKLNQGIDPKSEVDKRKSIIPTTVSEVAAAYERKHISQLAENTQTEYKRYLNNHIIPEFGDLEVKNLTKKEIVQYLDKIALEDGHKVTANRIKATLSGLYTFHIDQGNDLLDPTKSIKKYKEISKERVYSNSEIKELWHFFDNMTEPTGSLYKILLLLARRKSETWSARWDHIQDDKWTFPSVNVKTDNLFILPITDITREILDKLRVLNEDSEYIFQSPRIKNHHITSDSTAKKKVQDNTSIDDFTPHDLRRTAITKLSEIGTPRDIAEKISNHSQSTKNNSFSVYDRYDKMKEMHQALNDYHEHLLINILKH